MAEKDEPGQQHYPSMDFIVSQIRIPEIEPVFGQVSLGNQMRFADIISLRSDLFGIHSFGPTRTNSLICKVCCRKGPLFSCSRCGIEHYCNVKCQKLDWKAGHKTECTNVSRVA